MKKLPLLLITLSLTLTLSFSLTRPMSAQDLQRLATKGAVRLFGDKDDLTSVIMILPEGTVVEAISADTLYTLVKYDELQGYISSDRLTAFLPVVVTSHDGEPQAAAEEAAAEEAALQRATRREQPQQQAWEGQQTQRPTERFKILLDKYGADLARSIYQHKVWRGITTEMTRDSWGNPLQVNRRDTGSGIVEEWVYTKTALYFRGGVLTDWGPATR